MQQALIGTMLASQDLMDRRSNTFELFGADFMITEDYQPWLIEINASPDLGSTTKYVFMPNLYICQNSYYTIKITNIKLEFMLNYLF